MSINNILSQVNNGEFIKSKIEEYFATWRNRENLDIVIEGLKECVDKGISIFWIIHLKVSN